MIPPDPSTPGREGSLQERILGFHVHCASRSFEGFAEAYRVRHGDDATGAVYHHAAWYALGVVDCGRWKPYAGIDRMSLAQNDLFYVSGQTDLTRGTLGLRFETNPFNAIKLEYRHDSRPEEDTDALFVQTAFSF